MSETPALTIKRAAVKMREFADRPHARPEQFDAQRAVADWLSMAADHAAGRGAVCGSCVDQALAVARAYLGADA